MRALVVEDEKQPREILRDLIPWGSLGFDRVDAVRNGLEALALLEAGDVDLVITDVRMPKMDGVTLALEVHRRWPECVLIFLSGFSDKEYLKTAIRVQAQDYLDKPIDLDRVAAAVSQAAAQLARRRADRQAAEHEGLVLKQLSPLRRQAQVEALLGWAARTGVTLEDRFSQGPFRVVAVRPGPGIVPGPGWSQRISALVNGEGFAWPWLSAAPGPESSVALVADASPGSDAAALDGGLEAALDLFQHTEAVPLFQAGVAPAVPRPADLPEAWTVAEGALTEAFYRPTQRVFSSRPRSGRVLELLPETQALWQSLMAAKDYQAMTHQWDLLEQRTLSVRDEVVYRVKAVWLRAMEGLLDHVPAWGPAERTVRLEKLSRDFDQAPHLPALAAAARDCFDRLFLQSPADLQTGERIQRARSFVEARFTDPDLTVDAIASHVGYSESYFCTVFKQSQGITVKDYVTRFRIERAKAYLWEKEPSTLADLALKVGFRDPNYFGTVFRRLTGTTPGAYRKKALG